MNGKTIDKVQQTHTEAHEERSVDETVSKTLGQEGPEIEIILTLLGKEIGRIKIKGEIKDELIRRLA